MSKCNYSDIATAINKTRNFGIPLQNSGNVIYATNEKNSAAVANNGL